MTSALILSLLSCFNFPQEFATDFRDYNGRG